MNKQNLMHLSKSFLQRKNLLFLLFGGFIVFALLVTLPFLTSNTLATTKQNTLSELSTNDILIKIKRGSNNVIKEGNAQNVGIPSLSTILKKYNAQTIEKLAKANKKSSTNDDVFLWYKISLDNKTVTSSLTGKTKTYPLLQQLLLELKKDASVEAAEYDYTVSATAIPNDAYYGTTGTWGQTYADMWGMHRINPEPGWDLSTGSATIVVADIDTGIDRNHEDLSSNMWVNKNEIPNNGIDDDNNGYVDDYNGWNFEGNTNDPMDDNGHGTHTAGTIAGIGNNSLGVVGVNWQSNIMALKFLDRNGNGSTSNAVKALQYAADNGARISSNSWGCNCQSQAVDDALKYEHDKGMVIIAAAGNNNADALDFSPANNDNVITVGAIDTTDARASFSNYGQKIDVVAPGVDILSTKSSINSICTSTTVGTNYCRLSGTSMATPHVAGLAALLLAKNPNLSNEEVRQIIRANVYDLGPVGKDTNFGYGLINVGNSVASASSDVLTPYISSPGSRMLIGGNVVQVQGTIPGPNFANYSVEIGLGRNPSTWTTLVSSTTQVINGTLATFDSTILNDGAYIIRLTAHDTSGKSYQFQINDVQINNIDASITAPYYLISLGSGNAIVGTANTKNGLGFSNFKLEYGVGTSPTSYSTAGITLANNGLTPILNGTLGTWDTSLLLTDQVYTLRLTVQSNPGTIKQTMVQVTPDSHLVKGWPKQLTGSCTSCEGTPAMADLLGDGKKEVVVLGASNQIFAYKKDGTLLPNFPVTVTTGDHFKWPAVVDDIDGDGKQEIIAAAITSTNTARIYIVRGDGTLYAGWPMPEVSIWNGASISDVTPAIADIDGDGQKELVFYSKDSLGNPYLHAYHKDGLEVTGFPVYLNLLNASIQSAVTIADLYGDGKKEIILGDYDKLYVFDRFGNLLPGWPYQTIPVNGKVELFQSTPAVGDLYGNGKLEIIATAMPNGSLGNGSDMLLYALNPDGTIVTGFPHSTGQIQYTGWPLNSPSVGDFERTGKDEVAVGSMYLSIHTLTGTKTIAQFPNRAAPAVSDVKGDGNFEFAASGCTFLGFANPDGTSLWQSGSIPSPACFYDPAVTADLDNNGKMEMAAILSNVTTSGASVFLWEMDGGASQTAWPMFGHDSAHTGRMQLPADYVLPTVSISTPLNGATINGKTVTYSVNASDNVGVTKVEFYVDTTLIATSTAAPYTASWDTTTYSNGSHSLVAKAYDAAGNQGVSQTVTVIVNNSDTTPPTVTITSPVNGSKVTKNTNSTFTANASDAGLVSTGIAKVEFYVNGSLKCTDTTSPYACTWKVGPKAGVVYTLQAKAYDGAGNSAANSITVTSQ